MTQKERLVELLDNMPSVTDIEIDEEGNIIPNRILDKTEDLADYLLDNGVIVPPCKVGDTVYCIVGHETRDHWLVHEIIELQVCNIETDSNNTLWFDTFEPMGEGTNDRMLNELDIGVDLFFTRKEAEQALKEREADV